MISFKNSHSLTDFQRNSRSLLDQVNSEKSPLILTVSGKIQGVLVDPSTYEEMTRQVEELRLLKAIEAGEKAFRDGKSTSALETVQEILREYEI
ncbi:hypothetical protein C0431_07895 [bacterium]|jgi:prevent-host-death family protein|nr:hypothetical protein [bacterium]